MKLRYSALPCILLVAGTALAQGTAHTISGVTFAPDAHLNSHQSNVVRSAARDGGDVVFSEDFANGMNGNSGFGFWTTEGANGNIWRHTTAGPFGSYTDPSERIASTTVANGYMLFNSDSANTNWSDTTFVTNDVDWEGSLVSPLLDLSATPYVMVEFQQRFRYCCQDAPYFLEVSYDGGTSWTSQFPIDEGIETNDASGTLVTQVNITGAIAADPANVKFRFRHSADAGTSAYHWQIDDVKVIEVEEFDLTISSASNTHFDYDAAATFDSLQYSIFPFDQLRPLGLNMIAFNNGSVAQDATANFTVMRGSEVILDQDQEVLALAPGETRQVFVSPDFTPPAVEGTYDVTYSLSSDTTDLNDDDNTATSRFKVSQNIYARDAGNPWTWETGDSTSMILANVFHLVNPATLYSIAVMVGNGSVDGSFLVGDVRDTDLETIWGESEEVTVSSSIENGVNGQNFAQLMFDPPLDLEAGDYVASVQVTGLVKIGQSGTSVPQTSFIRYDQPGVGLDWYYTTTTPAIRMNFDATVGIADQDGTNAGLSAQSIPNPTNGVTRLVYELSEKAPVTIELVDVSGKIVRTFNEGTKVPGQHQLTFNVSDLQEGVYFHVVRAGDSEITGRMVVVK